MAFITIFSDIENMEEIKGQKEIEDQHKKVSLRLSEFKEKIDSFKFGFESHSRIRNLAHNMTEVVKCVNLMEFYIKELENFSE